MKRRAACLALLLSAVACGPASGGLLPPSVWESDGRPSEAILAFRGALVGALGATAQAAADLNKAERAAIAAFYEARAFAPLWVTAAGPTRGAEDLIATLRDAASHALEPEAYAFAVDAFDGLEAAAGPGEPARVEVALTAAALLYGRHAAAGQVVPRTLDETITIKPRAIAPDELLARLATGDSAADILAALHPPSDDYRALRAAYAALGEQSRHGGWTPVPDGAPLKPGMTDTRVAALAARLAASGDLEPGTRADGETYDDVLAEAVKRFQIRHGLADDAVVGPGTLAALNVSIEDRLKQIAANLEARRWLPDDLGERHVFVNQADYRMQVVDRAEVIHESRVIVGKREHETPVFSNQIAYVEFNPYWNVPKSIAVEEYLPILMQDPTVLARAGFETLDGATDQPIDPTQISWREIDTQAFPVRFRQPPGRTNALGTIKFMFPNEHAVYMHDTPSRGLFAQRMRALSHGCVRVQNPVDFAEILLGADGWSRQQIEQAVASGENLPIALKRKVPVHLAYWTAWVDPDGRLNFRDDVYGRDQALIAALGFNNLALKLADLSAN